VPNKTPNVVADAVAALELLALRGRIRFNEVDRKLLARSCQDGGIGWRGGIRQDSSGHLELIDAIDWKELLPDESLRLSQITAAAYLGFYDCAADGIALTAVESVGQRYGKSLKENYPEAGKAFLRFATTFWTLKVLIDRLELASAKRLALSLLLRIDDLVGDLFFSYDGPFRVDPDRREKDQRRFLCAFGPRIDREDFLRCNPILVRDRKTPRESWHSW